MLARLLRLLLLFEIFTGYLLAVGLVGLADWPSWAAFLWVLCLAATLRFWPVGLGYLLFFRQAGGVPGGRWNASALWRQMVGEWWAFCRLGWVCAFERMVLAENVRVASQTTGHIPLLLIHGYACNRGAWWWLKPRLESQGRQVATASLEPMQGDIDGYTEQIAQRVTWLRGRTHAKRVVLVGHGMGGLACLAYLRRYGEENVERLVILGAPLAGVSWLPAGWGRNLDQLRANSRWLSELAVFFGEWPLLTPRVNYQGRCDYWFPSPEAAPIQGLEARWLENVGHIGLLVSARVLDELLTSSE